MIDCIRILTFYPGQKTPPDASGYIVHYLNVEKNPLGLIWLYVSYAGYVDIYKITNINNIIKLMYF